MIEAPLWLQLLFIALSFIAIYAMYAASQSLKLLRLWLLVLVFTGISSMTGMLYAPDAFPPRIPILIIPAVVLMLWLFLSKSGKGILDSMDIVVLTWMHAIRVPVELGILALFTYGFMPESMTFEGRNFDVLSGLSAPLIAYFGYTQRRLSKRVLFAWNLICLLLVSQVLITGAFAAPSSMQCIDFDQPYSAVLFFPFAWLPAVIVPIVVTAHLIALRAIYKSTNQYK